MEFSELIKTPKLDGVKLIRPLHKPVDGTLCITSHHVLLSSRKSSSDTNEELWVSINVSKGIPNLKSSWFIIFNDKNIECLIKVNVMCEIKAAT